MTLAFSMVILGLSGEMTLEFSIFILGFSEENDVGIFYGHFEFV